MTEFMITLILTLTIVIVNTIIYIIFPKGKSGKKQINSKISFKKDGNACTTKSFGKTTVRNFIEDFYRSVLNLSTQMRQKKNEISCVELRKFYQKKYLSLFELKLREWKISKNEFFEVLKKLILKEKKINTFSDYSGYKILQCWRKLKVLNKKASFGISNNSNEIPTIIGYYYEAEKLNFKQELEKIKEFVRNFFRRNLQVGKILRMRKDFIEDLKKESELFFKNEIKYVPHIPEDVQKFARGGSKKERIAHVTFKEFVKFSPTILKIFQSKLTKGEFRSFEQFESFYESFFGNQNFSYFAKFLGKKSEKVDNLDMAILEVKDQIRKVNEAIARLKK